MKSESIQIPNFLSENLVDKLLNLYFKSCQIIGSKIHELKFDEVHYTGTKIKRFDFIDAKFENTINDVNINMEKIYDLWDECDLVPEIINYLNEEFQKINRNGKILNFTIFNLSEPTLPIHTDGNHIANKRDKRNVFNPVYKLEEYFPRDRKYTHQGLITLQNDDPRNGTIVFDQSFPYSVYYINNENNLERKKSVITFLKDDGIFRFDEKIKNYTHEYMSDEEHKLIPYLKKEELFGLSLDKKLMFMDKGNLVSWQVGKFHVPIPMKKEWGNRVMLQYEAVEE